MPNSDPSRELHGGRMATHLPAATALDEFSNPVPSITDGQTVPPGLVLLVVLHSERLLVEGDSAVQPIER